MKNTIVFVTNIPVPYREKMHEQIAKAIPGYTVFYCAGSEPDRHWNYPLGEYDRVFLRGRHLSFNHRHIHFNSDIIAQLNKFNPAVVIVVDYGPTSILAALWAKFRKKTQICMTDGWLGSERHLSKLHVLVRRLMFKNAKAFIAPSLHTIKLYESYGVYRQRIFRTYLGVNSEQYAQVRKKNGARPYDLVFSGQFIDRKCPLFFADVAIQVAKRLGSCQVLLLGDGDLKAEMVARLRNGGVTVEDAGFIEPQELPHYYCRGRIFLFPTKNDPWGVVANEACAAGMPVITTEYAGAAGDLIVNNETGYVLPLDVDIWVEHVVRLLQDVKEYRRLSRAAIEHNKLYNADNAARGIIDAVSYALEH